MEIFMYTLLKWDWCSRLGGLAAGYYGVCRGEGGADLGVFSVIVVLPCFSYFLIMVGLSYSKKSVFVCIFLNSNKSHTNIKVFYDCRSERRVFINF
jgi:hypothetical protein